MNKQEFIEWVSSLPDDFEVQPINMSEVTESSSD